MIGLFIATSKATATSAAVLVTLIASVLMLAVRAWTRTTDYRMHRRVRFLIDGVIILIVTLFLVLVVVRFRTLG